MTWSGLKAEKSSVTRSEEFIDYFERTWLNGQFQLTMWKNLEGWHNKVKMITRKIWLKLEQASTEVSIRQLMAGGALRSVPPKQSTKERRIKKIEEKFANGDYTLASALKFLGRILDFYF